MLKSPIDLAKAAWTAFTKRWKFYVLLTVVSALIPGLVFLVGGAIAAAVGIGGAAGGAGKAAVFLVGLVMLAAYIFAIYLSIIFYGGLMLAVANEQINSVRDAFNRAKPMGKDLFVVALIVGILVSLASLLFIIPGIYLAVCWAFAMWLAVLEGKKGMAALKASKAMVDGRWFAVFGRILAFVVIVWLVMAVPQAVFAAIRLPILAGIWSLLVSLVVGPVGAIYTYLLFQNLKQTKAPAPVVTA